MLGSDLLLLEFRVSHSKLQARCLVPSQLNSDMSCEPIDTATCPCVTRDRKVFLHTIAALESPEISV